MPTSTPPSPWEILRLDHVAIAVPDLEASIKLYRDVFGSELVERRVTEGRATSMVSAVLKFGETTVVLVQGTSPESQVSRYVRAHGAGVQHLAFQVTNLAGLERTLRKRGAQFATTIINGTGIRQAFTRRDPESGMMIELIERLEDDGRFTDESVAELFRQLEENDLY